MADIPGNNTTTATISVGGTVNSTLEFLGDHDWFKITLTAGQSITILVDGITLEDPYLYVRNSAGNLIYENDDINPGINRDSQLSFTATYSGTYYIDIGAWNEDYTGDYQVSVSVYTPPPLASYDQIADQLVEGYWGGSDHHFNVTQGGSITVNLTALTPAGQNLAREALNLWSDVIGVQFVEVSSGGQIAFDDNQEGAFSDSNWSGGIITSSVVNVSTQWLANYGTSLNSYSFQTYVHEIGHALGLGHAGNYNGDARYPFDALFENDAWVTSIMSYFDQTDNTYFAGQGFTQNFVLTPMIADIIAMSTLYGLSTITRTGNTTYGFNSNAGRAVFDATQHPGVTYTIFDSAGTDTLDYSGFGTNQLINLNAETFSNVGSEVGNVSIARGVIIENAIGGSGNDSLVGNDVANVLTGNGGNDTLNGGTGADTMIGGLGNDVYVVDQSGDVISEVAAQGNDTVVAKASYTLGIAVSIETMTTVNGSATTAINLTGNELAQSLYGNAGNNILSGMGGSDYLVGGPGNDQYYVDESDFIAETAGGGDDLILVLGNYTLREGAEIEALYALNQDGLEPVNLTGNEYGQSLYGSQGVNSLNGGAGNDYLVGLGGNDFLLGGAGNDNMAGGQGNDIYYVDGGDWVMEAAGEGDDLAVAFSGFALRPGESVETLAAAESAGAINLTGNELGQSLYGNAGANVLAGGGGADYLVGGAGTDTFVLSSSAAVSTIGDYAAGEVVDITQILSVAGGTDVVGGGYLKVTAGGQLQVDANGGGDSFVTVANVSGSGAVTIRYLSGGSSTDLAVARSSSQSAMTVSAVAAAGMAALVPTKADSDAAGIDDQASVADGAPSTGVLQPSELALTTDDSRFALANELDAAIDDSGSSSSARIIGREAPDTDAQLPGTADVAALPATLPGTELTAADAPSPLALGIAMPSAEQLQALTAAAEGGQHNQLVTKLVDALADSAAGNAIDALLDALPVAAAATSMEQLAQQFGAGSDPGHGEFAADGWFQTAFALDAFAPHPDANAAV